MMSGYPAVLANYVSSQNGAREAAAYWLLRSESQRNRRFRERATIHVVADGDWQRITINGQLFFWPRHAPIDKLCTLAGELQDRHHPHRYLWGATQILPGDVVLDVGACEGGFAREATSRGGRVIAVEPSRVMQAAIRRLFQAESLTDPTIAPVLLGRQAGIDLHFQDNAVNPGHSRICNEPSADSYPVRLTTVDTLCEELALERLDFVKCDAEGADVSILEGGLQAIARFRPKIAFCTYHNDGDYLAIASRLRALGYRVRGKGFHRVGNRLRVLMLHATHPGRCCDN